MSLKIGSAVVVIFIKVDESHTPCISMTTVKLYLNYSQTLYVHASVKLSFDRNYMIASVNFLRYLF